jgi:hypothetical protein
MTAMNFDVVFYHTLTPLVLAYKPFAATLFAAAFIFHWVRGAWAGSMQDSKSGWSFWKNAILTLLVYTLFYVPVPNPGLMLGFDDGDVDLAETHYTRTTAFIFVLERLCYGADTLGATILAWDVTIQAQDELEDGYASGAGGVVQTERRPNKSEITYNFLMLRAQYLQRYLKSVWNLDDLKPQTLNDEAEEDTNFGVWDLARALDPSAIHDFLSKQVAILLYNLASSFSLGVVFLVLLAVSMVLYLVAGLLKFAPIFIAALFLFLMPFGWFFNGRKVLNVCFNLMVIYIPMKTAIMLVVWVAFFMIEGIQLQGFREVAADVPVLLDLVERYQPGFLYTRAGSEILMQAEQGIRISQGVTVGAESLVSMLVVLLAMIYIIIKTPSIIAASLGIQSLSDDIVSSAFFLTTTVIASASALKRVLR